jgi:uncharacterized protein YdbL (DUF1318 family)
MHARVRSLGWMMALVVLGGAVRAKEESKDAIAKRLEGRLDALQEYKDAGKLGETNRGYVEAVKPAYLKDKKLKKLVAAENEDRRKLYVLVAEEQSSDEEKVSVEQVGKQNAIIKFRKAAEREYFKGKDGKWRTKKEMLEATKEAEGDG